jgi:hypothetical protein
LRQVINASPDLFSVPAEFTPSVRSGTEGAQATGDDHFAKQDWENEGGLL